MSLILKTIKIFKKYYQSIVVMGQHMSSMPVMRTAWRRELDCSPTHVSTQYAVRPSSEETTVFLRHMVLIIVCGWLPGMQGGHPAYQTANHTEASQKHSCFSWWWTHSRPQHVEIDKYTKNKLCTKLVLFTRLDRDAWSTKHPMWDICCSCQVYTATAPSSLRTAAESAIFKQLTSGITTWSVSSTSLCQVNCAGSHISSHR